MRINKPLLSFSLTKGPYPYFIDYTGIICIAYLMLLRGMAIQHAFKMTNFN